MKANAEIVLWHDTAEMS